MKQVKTVPMVKNETAMKQESAVSRAMSSMNGLSTLSSKIPQDSARGIVRVIISNFGTILLIVAAFLIGALWTEVRYLKKGGAGTTPTAAAPTTQAGGQQAVTLTKDQIKGLFIKGRIMFGDANKKVLFVEVSDPSCPFCHIAGGKDPELNAQSGGQFKLKADGGTYVPPVEEMRKLVDSGKAAFLWLYSPGHGKGEMGTKALYCAFEKGKFWQVHDLLMSEKGYQIMNGVDAKQQPTKGSIVGNDVSKVGLLAEFLKSAINPNDLTSCITSGKYDAKLTEDTQLAATLGYQGTPYFIVNTKSFPGAFSFDQMQADVTDALK